jgi:O-antigen/teichoic acid export membrane protein
LAISATLVGYLDTMLIPFYDHKGFATLAVYVVAVYFITLVNLPSKALMSASFTALTVAMTEKNTNKARDLFIRSSVNLLIPTLSIALIMCCNLNNAVAIIGKGKDYSGIVPVFLVLLVGQLVNIGTGMNDQMLTITNYYKFNFYASLTISALLFILIRFLVPVYGILGAAWANTITMIIYNLLKFFFIWKKLDMQPFSKNTLLVLICALPAFAGGYFFPYFFNPDRHIYVHTFIDAGLRSLTILIIYIAMLLWLKPSRDLEDYLATVKKNKRLF